MSERSAVGEISAQKYLPEYEKRHCEALMVPLVCDMCAPHAKLLGGRGKFPRRIGSQS